MYTILCKVNGKALDFYFDTGASDVSLSLDEARDLFSKGLLLPSDIIGENHYQTASGQIQVGVTVLITLIEIGDIKLLNVPALVTLTPNAPLLLGQSALNKLGKFEFDYSNLTLTITGPKKFDFLKFNKLNQNVQKNYYNYKNSTLFSEDIPKDEKITKWISKLETPIYKEPYSNTKVYTIKSNEPFTAINSEVHIYKMPIARITKIVADDFPECNSDKFRVGDLVYFLLPDWEGRFNVIYQNKETYINCSFDEEKMELSERAYEGCNNVEGKILSNKSEFILWVKVKTKNGIIGWLRNPFASDLAGYTAEYFEPAIKN
ncbi:retropepsin-like aspartic protease family protein [Ferruginibacter sp.]